MLGEMDPSAVRSGPSRGGGEFYCAFSAFEALILCQVWGVDPSGF